MLFLYKVFPRGVLFISKPGHMACLNREIVYLGTGPVSSLVYSDVKLYFVIQFSRVDPLCLLAVLSSIEHLEPFPLLKGEIK